MRVLRTKLKGIRKIYVGPSKGSRAYEQLKQAILNAEFRPGQVLTMRTLAASLGTSTMPVREATTRLITERALELLPNRGLRVPILTDEEAVDVLRARVLLEGLAVELAASLITDTEIAKLEQFELAAERALKQEQVEQAVRANIQFHLALYRASRSETLVLLIEALYLRYCPRMYTNVELLPGGRAGRVRFFHDRHTAIIDALRKRAPKQARAALERDMKDSWISSGLKSPFRGDC